MARIRRNVNDKITLEDLKNEFINDKESTGRSKQTIDNYIISIDKFIEYIGNIELSELDLQTVIQYRNHLRKSEELKASSINHYLRELRALINYAYEHDYIEKKIKVELIKAQEETKDVYTEEELEILLRKPTNINDFVEWRTYTIICYILGTGNRIETVCNLLLGDIDLNQRLVYIRKEKNKKVQTISIDKQLTYVLRKYIKDWRYEATENEFLFCNISGNKLTTNALQQSLREYNLKRGIEKTSAHLLRHTFAKMFILNGGSEFKLQQMLGHSTLEMTRHYVEIFGIDMRRDIDNVSPLVTLTKNKGGMEHTVKRNH